MKFAESFELLELEDPPRIEGRKKRGHIESQTNNSVLFKSRNSELKDSMKYFIIISGEVLRIENRDVCVHKNNEGYRRHLVGTHRYTALCVCAVDHAEDATLSNTQDRGGRIM